MRRIQSGPISTTNYLPSLYSVAMDGARIVIVGDFILEQACLRTTL